MAAADLEEEDEDEEQEDEGRAVGAEVGEVEGEDEGKEYLHFVCCWYIRLLTYISAFITHKILMHYARTKIKRLACLCFTGRFFCLFLFD